MKRWARRGCAYVTPALTALDDFHTRRGPDRADVGSKDLPKNAPRIPAPAPQAGRLAMTTRPGPLCLEQHRAGRHGVAGRACK
ncbi:hypothetical protein GCM10009525_84980 [Streptosporangium amethystogenes subsp. fukuiense]